MKNKIEWEVICYSNDGSFRTQRAKVFGGWIVTNRGENEVSSVFVPDPNHEWKL
jgi:hypothetical protein